MNKFVQVLADVAVGILAYKGLTFLSGKFCNFEEMTIVFTTIAIVALFAELIEISLKRKGK